MAVYKENIVDIDLAKGSLHRSFLTHTIGSGDVEADHFGVRVFRDGEPVDLTDVSVQGIFNPPQGSPIALTSGNVISGNVAAVVLKQACYNYNGQFCLSIKLVGGGVTGTMRIVDGVVDNTHSTGTVAPTEEVPTYQEVIAQYDAMVAATAAANGCIAVTFDATKAYTAGQYVINSGALYRLTADHAANTTWANTSKVEVKFGNELTDLKSAVNYSSLAITWTDGKYQNSSGSLIDHESYAVSDYIDISNYGDVVFSSAVYDAAAVVVFDVNYSVFAYYTNSNRENPFTRRIAKDNRIKYIRLCSTIAEKTDSFVLALPNLAAITSTNYTYSYSNLPATYRDANNLPANQTFVIRFNWNSTDNSDMAHWPMEGFTGTIVTVDTPEAQALNIWGFQLALYESPNNRSELYIRTRYTAWANWRKVALNDELGGYIKTHSNYGSYAALPEAYRDANGLPANTVISYHFGRTDEQEATLLHFPITGFAGSIMTINSVYDMATFGVQFAFNEAASGNRLWYRVRYVNWNDWVEIAQAGDTSTRSSGAFRGLGDFVLCGDSLSVSISYKASASAKNVKSWGRILADMINTECDVYAQGGIATGGYLSSNLYTQAVANESQFAILYLGTNDANQSVAKSTFKTNYKTIINGLLTNHQFVFCVNLPECTSASNRATYNEAIAEACEEIDHAFLVNVAKYNSTFAGFKNWGHLSSIGYAAFAQAASWAIDETMLANDYFDAGIDFPELE